ncbi:protein-glutamate O-methyltransferase [Chromobacterium sp. ATCC 53434]|uniref:CheR family methyltransferase n=1 Tax=Chromobacterium sp. (strain ATCC 53434 / SC 14030) TaxID=2059672 RepID=UPI000C758129|nr:protein-glutamate O-methyltransferase CheR [Chromobacterium sp. ATCC 53434]AUH50677.1 protein-glutamate O-methyltransferase [Chromobacterium sp. ATCC 53434]
MNIEPSSPLVAQFRDLIADRLGLQFDETKLGNLARVLSRHGGKDMPAYLAMLAAEPERSEVLHRLAVDLTVTETYFYRNFEQIQAFAEVAMPACLLARGGLPVRVLSAGCASGEEPYTLAIAAREAAGLGPGSVWIRAIDANPAMLAKAGSARYSAWSLREVNPAMRERWFARDGELYALNDGVRRSVRFEQRNLAQEDAELWAPDSYDIVFCRNVLMYFSPEQAQAAVARIVGAMAPGGYLFLGHAETLRGLSNDFHLCHTHATFYYRRKLQADEPAPAMQAGPPAWTEEPFRPLLPNDPAWVDAIARAAQRIDTLAVKVPQAAGDPAEAQPDLHHALSCLHKEQFEQSLALIEKLPQQYADDPDVLLLKAVSLSQSGALSAAGHICHALLARDELNAGAHYVLALCHEEDGDNSAALAHYRSAVYLDSSFALARLHIGVLERRMAELEAARRDLAQALILLQHEEPSRLLLFGGGFPRSALIDLCRAELAALGVSP